MISSLPPGILMIAGGLVLALLRGRALQVGLLLVPVLSAWHLLSLPEGTQIGVQVFSYELMPGRIDALSLVWGYIFHIAAFLTAIYAVHVKDRSQHVAGMVYVGAAIGAVFAGDMITLFVYWELTAVASVFLIWAKPTHVEGAARSEQIRRSFKAGMRYLVIQVGSGVILLAGILLHYQKTGSLAFTKLGLVDLGTGLIFIAFGIKAAFPLLHNWLQDAYPEATPTGTVFLSAFTTKMAIYALARAFPGTEILIYIGALMTAFPIFFAVIVNDLRRVLAYSLNSQLGFMIVGIGIGTEMSLNGTASHAFASVLYKALLFMSTGAVLHRTGTAKGSELGGLYKTMPWTTAFCIVGAASISAFPFFSGFVTKSLVMTAAAQGHWTIVWLVLLFASAGVFYHSGIKIPFFAFFAHDSGKRPKEAPLNMLIAMGITAFFCIAIGVYPKPLYDILPYAVDYEPYTTPHVINQYQLLIFSALAFTLLNRVKLRGTKLYPPELRSTVLDSDWTYRKLAPAVGGFVARLGGGVWFGFLAAARRGLEAFFGWSFRVYGPSSFIARTWTAGQIVSFAVLMLGFYLLFYFL